MAKGDRNPGWPGFFRAFTVLCAIVLLLAQRYLELTAPGSGARQALDVYEGLTLWSVPALFMLWGMFALEEGKPQASASLLGLALPALCLLVFWGAVYAVAAHLLEGGGFSWSEVWPAVLSAARGDTYGHLWVLYPLIGLYLIHPVLHRFAASASRGELRYFLGLCFLFAYLLPLLPGVLGAGNPVTYQLNRLQVHLASGWVGCYVGGWYLRHFEISRLAEYLLYVLGALGLAVTLAGRPGGLFAPTLLQQQQYGSLAAALTAAALCTLFRYVLGVSEERSRRKVMSGAGAYAFGIYLIHPLWLLVFHWAGISPLHFPAAASIPLFALALFLLSLPFAWLISLIPRVGPKLT